MNVRDSEVICGLLKSEGYKLTANHKDADIVILNTCSVRQHAEDKVWSEVGRFKKKSQSHKVTKLPVIGIVGCMAQNYKEAIFDRAPNVDFVVGPSDIHKIPEIVSKLCTRYDVRSTNNLLETKIWETNGGLRPEQIYHTGFYEDENHAYVVISEGCSNFCSFCIVPYVRGPLQNRNHKDILKEIEEAIDRGIDKITLLGQNVNAYQFIVHSSKFIVNFPKLLKMINDIKGLKEFSFITSHPKDTSIDLFKAMTECDKLKKYLHLPVQSGSNRILKLMNRGYSREFYLDLTENYRKIVKDGKLTTDIIVGFPGEKEADFQDTVELVKKIKFDAAYIFKYSPRLKTEAANFTDDVEKKEKEKRHSVVLELQKKISLKKR